MTKTAASPNSWWSWRCTNHRAALNSATLTVSGRPDPPENCTIQNQTADALLVDCDAGFDGGLPQQLVMEVYDSQSRVLVSNVTGHRGLFLASGLPSGLGFDIAVFAVNSKGPSDVTHLSAHTLKSAARRSGHGKYQYRAR